METVYIPHLLQRPKKQWQVEIADHLPGLDSLTPVRGAGHRHPSADLPGGGGQGGNDYYPELRSLPANL